MRELRLFLFFVVGLVLGGGSVVAFAQASSYGSSINFNYPNGLNLRRVSPPLYDFQSAPDGWGKMRDINRVGIGGKMVDITGTRLFSPGALAATARGAARFLGPLGLGLTLADLVWDETEGWLIPGEEGGESAPMSGGYTLVGPVSFASNPMGDACRVPLGDALLESMLGFWGQTQEELRNRINAHALPSYLCSGKLWVLDPAMTGYTTGDRVRLYYKYQGSAQDIRIGWSAVEVCDSGQRLTATGRCVNPTRPATDEELEDAIYIELVARGMGSDLARRLIEAGYKPAVDSVEADGPASVPGDTITSTTSGPAGQTTSTTNTTHNLTYNTNTTNNTTTVEISTTTTTTTVGPDGATTTETTTESPAEGETSPPEEPKPFCELYPSASACQELGETADEELGEESVDVSWDQQGGAAGSCPAPIQISVLGTQHAIQWTPICQVASGIRPIVIGLAWLSAALWLFLMARARA